MRWPHLFHRHNPLDADEPGAPPGFLLDLDDKRSPSGCDVVVPPQRADLDGDELARGRGEVEI